MRTFYRNIHHLCQQANIALIELSELADVPYITLSSREPFLPTPLELIRLSDHFGISIDHLLRKDLAEPHSSLKDKDMRLLILDVDGVLTDGGMYYSEEGTGDEFKKFNAKDGMGIKQLLKRGFPIGIISSGLNINLIRRRANLLGIPLVHAGPEPKEEVLRSWCKDLNINLENTIHFGDDINDLGIMGVAGLSVCPADAVPAIRRIANLRMSKNGGAGCVREFIDAYLLPYLDEKGKDQAKPTS